MARQQDLDPQARARPAGRHDHHADRPQHRPAAARSTPPASSRPARSSSSRVDSLGRRRVRGDARPATSRSSSASRTSSRTELVRLVGQTAILRFRAVYAAEQVAPPVAGRPPSRGPDDRAELAEHRAVRLAQRGRSASAQRRRAATSPAGNNRPAAAPLPTAPPAPTDAAADRRRARAPRRPRRSTGSRARPTQADFAAFTCADARTGRRLRPAAVLLQPGGHREVPARPDADRGQPAHQRRRRHPAEQRELGRQPRVQRRGRRPRSRTRPGALAGRSRPA